MARAITNLQLIQFKHQVYKLRRYHPVVLGTAPEIHVPALGLYSHHSQTPRSLFGHSLATPLGIAARMVVQQAGGAHKCTRGNKF